MAYTPNRTSVAEANKQLDVMFKQLQRQDEEYKEQLDSKDREIAALRHELEEQRNLSRKLAETEEMLVWLTAENRLKDSRIERLAKSIGGIAGLINDLGLGYTFTSTSQQHSSHHHHHQHQHHHDKHRGQDGSASSLSLGDGDSSHLTLNNLNSSVRGGGGAAAAPQSPETVGRDLEVATPATSYSIESDGEY